MSLIVMCKCKIPPDMLFTKHDMHVCACLFLTSYHNGKSQTNNQWPQSYAREICTKTFSSPNLPAKWPKWSVKRILTNCFHKISATRFAISVAQRCQFCRTTTKATGACIQFVSCFQQLKFHVSSKTSSWVEKRFKRAMLHLSQERTGSTLQFNAFLILTVSRV